MFRDIREAWSISRCPEIRKVQNRPSLLHCVLTTTVQCFLCSRWDSSCLTVTTDGFPGWGGEGVEGEGVGEEGGGGGRGRRRGGGGRGI